MLRNSRRLLTRAARDTYNSFVLIRAEPKRGSGPLQDTTFIVKDNITTTEEPTTCGSGMLKEYTSPFDATVVTLLKAAGLALVGKSNLDEFGMGSSTTFSVHGATVNPRFEDVRIAGGSSGGSAAAIAANLADFALGTDTGGSVREPASYCGIVGYKPTYGRISRYGVIAYAQGFDTVGILARDVGTAKRVFEVLDKYDKNDITSLPQSIRDELAKKTANPEKLTISIPQELIMAELGEETVAEFEKVVGNLMEMGHTIKPVSVPSIGKLLSAYYTLATAEAASNLSRFDGIRYGYSKGVGSGVDRISRNRAQGFGPEVQRRIVLGNYTLSSESGDNYFKATKLRKEIVGDFDNVFALTNPLTGKCASEEGCDILISPTTFGKAPTLEEFESDCKSNFLNGYINDVLTVPVSLAGLPAISVPCGNKDYGVQLMGQYGDDSAVLAAAALVEDACK